MNNKLEVIGIDHGWSMMKTISQVFVTGVKEITTTPALFGGNVKWIDEMQTVQHKNHYRNKLRFHGMPERNFLLPVFRIHNDFPLCYHFLHYTTTQHFFTIFNNFFVDFRSFSP